MSDGLIFMIVPYLAGILVGVMMTTTVISARKEKAAKRPAPIAGRKLYTGSPLAGDWHSAPPFVMLSDGRWYEREAGDDE